MHNLSSVTSDPRGPQVCALRHRSGQEMMACNEEIRSALICLLSCQSSHITKTPTLPDDARWALNGHMGRMFP